MFERAQKLAKYLSDGGQGQSGDMLILAHAVLGLAARVEQHASPEELRRLFIEEAEPCPSRFETALGETLKCDSVRAHKGSHCAYTSSGSHRYEWW